MYPDSFKEELDSGLCCDALLAGNQNHHLRKVINNQKTQSFPRLVDRRPDMKSIEMDSHGLSGVGRGVYRTTFLVVGLDNNAGSAGPDILVDLLSKFRPVEMFM
jgi:hypothetical protein